MTCFDYGFHFFKGKYDYANESAKFYQNLRENQKRKHKETPITFKSFSRFKHIIKETAKKIKKTFSDSKYKRR